FAGIGQKLMHLAANLAESRHQIRSRVAEVTAADQFRRTLQRIRITRDLEYGARLDPRAGNTSRREMAAAPDSDDDCAAFGADARFAERLSGNRAGAEDADLAAENAA